MTNQAKNFLNLCQMEGNSVESVTRALGMVKPSVRKELEDYYSVSNINSLAAKIAFK